MTMLPVKKISPSLRPRSIFEPFFEEFFGDEDQGSFFGKLMEMARWDERMGSMDFEMKVHRPGMGSQIIES